MPSPVDSSTPVTLVDVAATAMLVALTVQWTKVLFYRVVNPLSPNRAWYVRLYTLGISIVYVFVQAALAGVITRQDVATLYALAFSIAGTAVLQYHILQDDPTAASIQARQQRDAAAKNPELPPVPPPAPDPGTGEPWTSRTRTVTAPTKGGDEPFALPGSPEPTSKSAAARARSVRRGPAAPVPNPRPDPARPGTHAPDPDVPWADDTPVSALEPTGR